MSSEKEQKKGGLVPSGKQEIEKDSSKIISRGLELVKVIEQKQKEGVAYGDLGGKDIGAFKQAIKLKPDDAKVHYNLGVAYVNSGRYSEAIEASKQAIRINPDHAEAHHGLGYIYFHLRRYDEAIEAYKQAIRINPDHAMGSVVGIGLCYYQLGLSYHELRRYSEAIEAYKEAIRIHPDYAVAHYGLGRVYLEVKDKSMAIEQYKILKNLLSRYYPLPITDENTQDIREKANTLFDLIYKLEAKELAMGREKAIPSRDYLVWLEKGFEMEKLGKYQEAIEAFRNCIRLAPPGHGDNLISLIEIKTPKLAMEMKKFWK